MARPVRVECPGAVYHVTARGDERKLISRVDHDRGRFRKRCCRAAKAAARGGRVRLRVGARNVTVAYCYVWLRG